MEVGECQHGASKIGQHPNKMSATTILPEKDHIFPHRGPISIYLYLKYHFDNSSLHPFTDSHDSVIVRQDGLTCSSTILLCYLKDAVCLTHFVFSFLMNSVLPFTLRT